ncbi:fungal-specific transcription factor domain-containing protein [Umbelopsis sp. PMI_123]|nr:fungal-specific transcription factor domain-containing protein [Umbelopsis sp. PMI_123]
MQTEPDPHFAPPPPLGFSSLRLMQNMAKPIMEEVSAEHDKQKSAQGSDLIIKKYESPEADRTKDRTKATKVANACLPCRGRKLKCDGMHPCSRCIKNGNNCTFPEGVTPSQRKTVSNDDYNSLEDSVTKLESLYHSLFQGQKGSEQAFSLLLDLLKKLPESSTGSPNSPQSPFDPSNNNARSAPLPPMGNNISFSLPPSNQPAAEPQATAALNSVNIDVIQSLTFASGQHFMGETSFYMMPAEAKQQYRNQRTSELPFPGITAMPPTVSFDDQVRLINVFYQHLNTYFPIMSKPLMLNQHYAYYHGQPSCLSPFFMYAIFAAAAPFSENARQFCRDSNDGRKELHTAGDQFLQYAIHIKESYMDAPRISTIIGLVLLSFRLETEKFSVNSMRSWMLSGEAFRMSQDMGLHRNCENMGISVSDRQLRSRIFWAVFAYDRTLSMLHGRPLAFDEKDIDAPLPEIDLETDVDMKETLRQFLQYVKLSKVSGRIIKHNYSPQSGTRASYKQDAMLSTLDSWLASVLMDLPEDMKYDPSNAVVQKDNKSGASLRPPFNQGSISKDDLPASQFGKLLHLKLHTLLILLHRPYIADTAGSSGQKPQQPRLIVSRPSLDICTYASTIITHICNEMSAKDLSMLAKTCTGLYAMIAALRIHLMNALSTEARLISVGEANFERGLRLLKSVWTNLPGEMVSETLYSLEQQYRSKGKQIISNIKNSPHNGNSPMSESALSTPTDPQQRMESFSSPRDGSRTSGSSVTRMNDSEESLFQFVPSKRDPATGTPKHTLPLKIIPYGPPGEASSTKQQNGNNSKEKTSNVPSNGAANGITNGMSNGGNSLSPASSISTQNTPPMTHLGYNVPLSLTPNSSSIQSSMPSTPYEVNDNLGYVSNGFFSPLPNGNMAHADNLIFSHPHMTPYPDSDAHMTDILMNEMEHINNNVAVFSARNHSGFLLDPFLHDDHHMHEVSMMNGSSGNQINNAMVVCRDEGNM